MSNATALAGSTNPITIDVEGTFDRQAAWRVGLQLLEARTNTIHIDFHRVRLLEDLALPVLADALRAAKPKRVIICGLSRHQELILRYLGVDSDR